MTRLIEFDKQSVQSFLAAIRNGEPVCPGESGWSESRILMLAGACRFLVEDRRLTVLGTVPLCFAPAVLRRGRDEFDAETECLANLSEQVSNGAFRAALMHRINTLTIEIPPLRERREDIPLLCDHILRTFQRGREESPAPPASGGDDGLEARLEARLAPEVLEALRNYDWPGNVRELENVLKRAAVLSAQEQIALSDLPPYVSQADPILADVAAVDLSLAELERRHLLRVLEHTAGNKTQAAQILGITTKTLYNKLALYAENDETSS